MAQFGEKVWFRKIGEDGVSSFASRMTQGIFVGHHDRRHWVMLGNRRTGKVCVAHRGKWWLQN